MDLGFARRQRTPLRGNDTAASLATLLANLSARQAVSQTARVQAMLSALSTETDKIIHPAMALFVTTDDFKMRKTYRASFNPVVAAAIVTAGQSL